jgi:cell division protein FtsB
VAKLPSMAGAASARSPRPRIAPRSGRRAAPGAGIRWERVGRVALLFVLGVIVLLYIPPVKHWIQQSGTAARGHAQVRELKRERALLEARLRALTGPGAVEREARRLGMVRPGERPYVVQMPGRR